MKAARRKKRYYRGFLTPKFGLLALFPQPWGKPRPTGIDTTSSPWWRNRAIYDEAGHITKEMYEAAIRGEFFRTYLQQDVVLVERLDRPKTHL
jgi:hypothetical protein